MKNLTDHKIKTIKELSEIIRKFKKKKKRIVLSHGVFDLLHPGHIKHFEEAKKHGDILIVTVTKDKWVNKGPGRPAFNQRLRAEALSALRSIDYVAINEWPTAVETIHELKPDIYFKGSDYKKKSDDLTGMIREEERAIKSIGGELKFTEDITFSSSGIINQYYNVYPENTESYLKKFKKKYSADLVIDKLRALNKLKVLVIGDTIIDEYHYCIGMGKPQKADIIATKYLNEEWFTGGAVAVARHVANFCGKVHLVSAIGPQPVYKDFIQNNIAKNIHSKLFIRDDVPTIIKRRFLNPSFYNKNFEIYYFDDREMKRSLSKKVCSYLKKVIKDYDLVIAADFGHGFINQDMVNVLSKKSNFLAVNTQLNSANMGYNLITKYPTCDYICIDEPEARLAVGNKFGSIGSIVKDLKKKIKCDHITITRGHNGANVYNGSKACDVPVFSKEVVDRLGAGDAFLSITSPMVYKKYPKDLVGFVGSAVGALAVLIVGNKSPVEPVSLYKFVTALLK